MKVLVTRGYLFAAMLAAPGLLNAQLKVFGDTIDFHGFISEGFAKTDDNNYLTMNTTSGAIGYVGAGASTESVRVLEVE